MQLTVQIHDKPPDREINRDCFAQWLKEGNENKDFIYNVVQMKLPKSK